ncbi:hypothetical protein [Clostridiisalibacter paucivorans]|uniref:hypothetical protein n=1 Tax=Clostridiisalibacter paucivorans TaxID=408753 RepID=UPI000478CF68|nr:hypothetical protein [Clostridiisalibacter paucivorans]
MGKRMERYHNKRYKRTIRLKKSTVVFLLIVLFLQGIFIVDNCYNKLMCVNSTVFSYEYDGTLHTIYVMGKEFDIDQKKIDDFIDKIKYNISYGEDFIAKIIEGVLKRIDQSTILNFL